MNRRTAAMGLLVGAAIAGCDKRRPSLPTATLARISGGTIEVVDEFTLFMNMDFDGCHIAINRKPGEGARNFLACRFTRCTFAGPIRKVSEGCVIVDSKEELET